MSDTPAPEPELVPPTPEKMEEVAAKVKHYTDGHLSPDVGPITKSAYEYAQQLVLLFDSHTHEAFEKHREWLMQQLIEFSEEFVVLTNHAEQKGILNGK